MEHRYPQLVLEKGRSNVIPVSLGQAIPDDPAALRAQVRERPSETAPLVATWSIAITDAAAGDIVLTLAPDWATNSEDTMVYTDVILVSTDATLMPVLECSVVEGVTA